MWMFVYSNGVLIVENILVLEPIEIDETCVGGLGGQISVQAKRRKEHGVETQRLSQ